MEEGRSPTGRGDVTLLWQLRRRIVAHLENAPMERRAGLRAALRGLDLLLRSVFENRQDGRKVARN